jgi:hypothetical protein
VRASAVHPEPAAEARRAAPLGVGFSKRILPGFGLEREDDYLWLNTAGEETASGFGNLSVNRPVVAWPVALAAFGMFPYRFSTMI